MFHPNRQSVFFMTQFLFEFLFFQFYCVQRCSVCDYLISRYFLLSLSLLHTYIVVESISWFFHVKPVTNNPHKCNLEEIINVVATLRNDICGSPCGSSPTYTVTSPFNSNKSLFSSPACCLHSVFFLHKHGWKFIKTISLEKLAKFVNF